MPARSSVDALDALSRAVEHLIAAIERSKRHESIAFWGEIEHARSCLAQARLEMRASAPPKNATAAYVDGVRRFLNEEAMPMMRSVITRMEVPDAAQGWQIYNSELDDNQYYDRAGRIIKRSAKSRRRNPRRSDA
jgi:hypothetical protein